MQILILICRLVLRLGGVCIHCRRLRYDLRPHAIQNAAYVEPYRHMAMMCVAPASARDAVHVSVGVDVGRAYRIGASVHSRDCSRRIVAAPAIGRPVYAASLSHLSVKVTVKFAVEAVCTCRLRSLRIPTQ